MKSLHLGRVRRSVHHTAAIHHHQRHTKRTENGFGSAVASVMLVENYRENWVPFRPLTGPTMCARCFAVGPHQHHPNVVDSIATSFRLHQMI